MTRKAAASLRSASRAVQVTVRRHFDDEDGSKMPPEEELDKGDDRNDRRGLSAEIVLIYPIEDTTEKNKQIKELDRREHDWLHFLLGMKRAAKKIKLKRSLARINKRLDGRAEAIVAMREAGLRAIISQLDENTMCVKISASKERLQTEADRIGIEMRIEGSHMPQPLSHSESLKSRSTSGWGSDYGKKSIYGELSMFQDDSCWQQGWEGFRTRLTTSRTAKMVKMLTTNIFPSLQSREYRDYSRHDVQDYARKEGRLFSSLEKQRLVESIIESRREAGGAEQDFGRLKGEGYFPEIVILHCPKERDKFYFTWGRMVTLGGRLKGKIRTQLPDAWRTILWLLQVIFYAFHIMLVRPSERAIFHSARAYDLVYGATLGTLIILALSLGMLRQPLHELRDYYGEKIAFYFSWIEHYTRYLIYLTVFAIIAVAFGASEVVSSEMNATNAWWKCVYCLGVALWTTIYIEGWKRKTAVIAHTWDVTSFEEEEEPRAQFISNFYRGRWAHVAQKEADNEDDENDEGDNGRDGGRKAGPKPKGRSNRTRSWCTCMQGSMEEETGIFTSDNRFIKTPSHMAGAMMEKYFPYAHRRKVYMVGSPNLLIVMCVMVIGTSALLVFRFLVDVSRQFRSENEFWDSAIGRQTPAIFSALWITIMNVVYYYLAVYLNDLENYRTETEYSDHLIYKISIFYFINSYITLIYIAFIKANGLPIGVALAPFGYGTDVNGDPLNDMCGLHPMWNQTDYDGVPYRSYATVPASSEAPCNTSAPDLESSGCAFIFVERDCSEDLRALMIAYTLLKPCYEAILQCIPVVATMLYASFRVKRKGKQIAKFLEGLVQKFRSSQVRSSRSSSSTRNSAYEGIEDLTAEGSASELETDRPRVISRADMAKFVPYLQASVTAHDPSPQAEFEQVDVLHDGHRPKMVRFTASTIPGDISSQSADDDDDVDEGRVETGKVANGNLVPEEPAVANRSRVASAPTSTAALICASFDIIPASAVLEVRIRRHAYVMVKPKPYLEHEVEVTLDGLALAPQRRRYSQFVELHKELKEVLGLKPLLIPKLWRHNEGLLRHREGLMEEFLKECINKARARQQSVPSLEMFLGLQFRSTKLSARLSTDGPTPAAEVVETTGTGAATADGRIGITVVGAGVTDATALSPPPSPPEAMSASETSDLLGDRLEFHKQIEKERGLYEYEGTFDEYNTKVIQFGYIAMFSAAFPLAAVCSAVANFNEIRLDAIKTLSSQRPHYEGAQNIGTWQEVLRVFSWLALPINVGILVGTSWSFREHILIPALFPATCEDASPLNVTAAGMVVHTLPADALITTRARFFGDTTSIMSDCAQNVNDCFAPIGGVSWLPASTYFDSSTLQTKRFSTGGLCDSSSILHNELHCEQCQQWEFRVWSLQILIFILVEHLLILTKLFVAYLIPDKPRWVQDAEAISEFRKVAKIEERKENASVTSYDPVYGGMIHLNILPDIDVDLRISVDDCSSSKRVPYEVAGPEKTVDHLKSMTKTPIVTGFLSPLTRITLTKAECVAAGIPTTAATFAFAYPLENFPARNLGHGDDDTAGCLLFLQMGGFVYFDQKLNVLQVNAIAPNDERDTELTLMGPSLVSTSFVSSLERQERMQDVTVTKLKEAGFEKFGWVHPAERVDGKVLTKEVGYPDGAFVYKMRDSRPVMYTLAIGDSARKMRGDEIAIQSGRRGDTDELRHMHMQLSGTVTESADEAARLRDKRKQIMEKKVKALRPRLNQDTFIGSPSDISDSAPRFRQQVSAHV